MLISSSHVRAPMLISLFSDASLCDKMHVGGWAAWLKADRGSVIDGGSFSVKVSDITLAEAMAVANGLYCGLRYGLVRDGDTILIQTDNNAVMGILNGITKRRASRLTCRKRNISMRALRRQVAIRNFEINAISTVFLDMVNMNHLTIRWRHVKGHRGTIDKRSAVNSLCDRVAKNNMRAARNKQLPTIAETPRLGARVAAASVTN